MPAAMLGIARGSRGPRSHKCHTHTTQSPDVNPALLAPEIAGGRVGVDHAVVGTDAGRGQVQQGLLRPHWVPPLPEILLHARVRLV